MSRGTIVALALLACSDREQTPEARNTTCFAPATPADVAVRLRSSGCVDPADPRRAAPGLLPYTVRAPLWSDGADKERHLALPEGGTLRAIDGHLELPAGALLMKTFLVGGKAVETRLLLRHADGRWAGYSYDWLPDGTDAELVGEDARWEPLGEREWQFPSRQHCLDCHTEAAGRTLGLELAQLERDRLAAWARRGLFPDGLPAAAPLPRPSDAAAPLSDRARAYLHANCANCHRPGGVREPNVVMDLRFSTPFGEMQVCGERPRRTDFGLAEVKLLAPGDPDGSMLWLRMHTLVPSDRMPPVASSVEDLEGGRLLRDWIHSVRACP